MAVLQTGLAKSLAEDYTIDQSLRFTRGDQSYLERTAGTPTDGKKLTASVWVKGPSTVGGGVMLEARSTDWDWWGIDAGVSQSHPEMRCYLYGAQSRADGADVKSYAFYRDPSAWYHYMLVIDTTLAEADDRIKFYVNGDAVSTNVIQSIDQNELIPAFNESGTVQSIQDNDSGSALDYLAEYHFIDGQALTPSDFGETDDTTNQWKPIEYEGTYGNNGFYQKYASTELANSFTDSSHIWTCPSGVSSIEVLVVGGGGGAGGLGGGGGAGGVVHNSSYSVTEGVEYDITVGAGGATTDYGPAANNGSDSVFNVNAEGGGSAITALGGGAGSGGNAVGGSGGSGGGGNGGYSTAGGSGTQADSGGGTGYGEDGGDATYPAAGGGGGANAAGTNSSGGTAGDGGAGKLFSTFVAYGTDSSNSASTGSNGGYFGGGGGGGAATGNTGGSAGANGGGGAGTDGSYGASGLANTGGGAGGGNTGGGSGGSGIVLIDDGSTITAFTSVGPHTITANGDVANARGAELDSTYTKIDAITSTGAGTWTCPTGVTSVEILTVAGGGGGGDAGTGAGGGGGAGGVVHNSAYTVVPGVEYDITVGTGGANGTGGSPQGSNGADSVFNVNAEGSGATVTAVGGGGGGQDGGGGANGGSGGGAGADTTDEEGSATQGDSGGGTGYGNDGGNANETVGTTAEGGGGGGASAVGGSPPHHLTAGSGGAGKLFSTFVGYGTDSSNVASTGANGGYFGGGGGGGSHNSEGDAGVGGVGGGANGTYDATAVVGKANTGGGGAGPGAGGTGNGSAGGTGVVLIAYSQDKPGTSSIAFDGTGDYLSTPSNSDFDFGTGEFTLEGWLYSKNDTDAVMSDSYYQTGENGNWAIVLSASSIDFHTYDGQGSYEVASSSSALPKNGWHHLALVRESDTITFYLDGASIGTGTVTKSLGECTDNFLIGEGGGNPEFDGYMDEIRISDTARYTSTFTPQTTQFTADVNTMLLIHSDWDGGLGADSSGNENDFAATNLVATDQMKDSPTNNFATLNPLDNYYASSTFSEGNLEIVTGDTSIYTYNSSTITMSSGKWYCEFLVVADSRSGGYLLCGISSGTPSSITDALGDEAYTYAYLGQDGKRKTDGVESAYGNVYALDDIVGIALDLENNKLYFSVNGTWQDSGDPTSGATGTGAAFTVTAGGYRFCISDYDPAGYAGLVINFGQDSSFAGNLTAQGNQDGNSIGDFYYEPPSGYLALCSSNLPDPEIKLPGDNFNTILRDGTYPSGGSFTVGFQPDFIWQKPRDLADGHYLVDAVRGASKIIKTESTAAESTDANFVASFDSDGFTMGSNDWETSVDVVAWNWLGANGTATNESGSITSTVSANTTAGFSIIKYTANNTVGDTIGHGLTEIPELLIFKNLDRAFPASRIANWSTFSNVLASDYSEVIALENGDAASSYGALNDTAPTASIVTLGSNDGTNYGSDDYICYAFHSIEGFSKVGGFVGNYNADGAFIYLGFRPAWFMWKRAIGGGGDDGGWAMMDDKRNAYNVMDTNLYVNSSGAEETKNDIDFVSNGVKMRNTEMQGTSTTYLYLAFAESPFKYANAR